MKKINQYKRTYYKEQGAIIGLFLCFVVFLLPGLAEKGNEYYTKDPEPLSPRVVCVETLTGKIHQYASGTPVISIKKTAAENCYIGTDKFLDEIIDREMSIEDKIIKYFPKSNRDMLAIAKSESRLKMSAVNYNCLYKGYRYKNQKGKTITVITDGTPLQEQVEGVISTSCQPEDAEERWSMDCGIFQINTTARSCPKETVDQHLQRAAALSRKQNKTAWSSYKTGAHKEYLAKN